MGGRDYWRKARSERATEIERMKDSIERENGVEKESRGERAREIEELEGGP